MLPVILQHERRISTTVRILCAALAIALLAVVANGAGKSSVKLTGDLRKWQPLALTFEGPETSEEAQPNPFTDYRLEVTFHKGSRKFIVPGYFAADGNAAETSDRAAGRPRRRRRLGFGPWGWRSWRATYGTR